ncbi:MAG: hypothetical protein AAF617_01015 [Bacteroidota bacterium]
MKTNLNITTKNLYQVFKNYTIVGNLRTRSSDYEVTDSDIHELLSKEMHLLTEDEIGNFMRSGITTFGDVTDFKHFLPRILELMQFDDGNFTKDFILFEKLNHAKWQSWDDIEIKAMQDYFVALWTKTINDSNATFAKIEAVLMLITTYLGWDKTFAIWEKSENLQWIHYAVDITLESRLYSIDTTVKDKLLHWFSTEKILSKIENAFFQTKDTLEANRISIAHTILKENGN